MMDIYIFVSLSLSPLLDNLELIVIVNFKPKKKKIIFIFNKNEFTRNKRQKTRMRFTHFLLTMRQIPIAIK